MLGGTVVVAPEKTLKDGWRVSLNFVPDAGSVTGGPITTVGLIVEIENDGCRCISTFR